MELQGPKVDWCVEHILEYLFEVGPTCGEYPLTHTELRNWQENTGIELCEFEATALVSLSREYLSFMQEAKEDGYPRPVRLTPEQKAAIGARQAEAARARAAEAKAEQMKG